MVGVGIENCESSRTETWILKFTEIVSLTWSIPLINTGMFFRPWSWVALNTKLKQITQFTWPSFILKLLVTLVVYATVYYCAHTEKILSKQYGIDIENWYRIGPMSRIDSGIGIDKILLVPTLRLWSAQNRPTNCLRDNWGGYSAQIKQGHLALTGAVCV